MDMTTNSNEELLRSEIEDLKRQLAEQKKLAAGRHDRQPAGPSGRTLAVVAAAGGRAGGGRLLPAAICPASAANRCWPRNPRPKARTCPWSTWRR